jgi:hypothetical protein
VEERPITSLRLSQASYKLIKDSGHMIVIDYVYEGGMIQ